MSRSGTTSSVVVDANLAIRAVLPEPSITDVAALLAEWKLQGHELLAPDLWLAEAVSAIRRAVYAGEITSAEARTALDDLFDLDVRIVPVRRYHCYAALDWAERLGQVRAYDAFYLALTEELGAELWTADRRLANAAQQAGVSWVRGVS